MSVINKMLRDLDQREGGVDNVQVPAARALPLRSGTSSLPAVQPRKAQVWMPLAITGIVLLAGGAAWWWSRSEQPSGPATSAPSSTPNVTLAPAPLTATPVAEPPALGKEAVKPAEKEAVKEAVKEVTKEGPQVAAKVVAPLPVKESPAAKDSKAIVKEVTKEVVVLTKPPVPAPAPAPALVPATPPATVAAAPVLVAKNSSPVVSSVTSVAEPVNPATRQIQAGRDALAQAQTLWNAGSHDAAVDLLQGAIGVVERNAAAAPSVAQTQLLASLARELGRMHLADGRPAAAVDALAHLEPQLGREADIWAMRGNAAQRLGRHQDSVNAYAAALQLRPNEQRWLLGSAVSLAALGQTAQAADMLEKARALGPVSKEVQTYLRQAGVRVAEP